MFCIVLQYTYSHYHLYIDGSIQYRVLSDKDEKVCY